MEFGKILKKLRTDSGQGIKKLAPELGVSYTYLSKLENGAIAPSEKFVGRVAKYFSYSQDALLLSAGKVPSEVLEILRKNPDEAVNYLRERFGSLNESGGRG